MRQYHSLTIERIERETADSVRVALSVPEALRQEFAFLPGQHLPVQATVDGKKLRRTYSICSAPGRLPLEIGVRIQPGGQFSGFVGDRLAAGDPLEAMPPFGRFHVNIDPAAAKTYIAFAAGSGITPVLSILRATLEQEPMSRFVLFYGNRRQRTTMFIEDLYALKNRYPERLQLYFVFSREEQEFPIFSGRLDAEKARELYRTFCAGLSPDEAFICGPDTMIDAVRGMLEEEGLETSAIHSERYGAPVRRKLPGEKGEKGTDLFNQGLNKSVPFSPFSPAEAARSASHLADVTVVMDGHRKTFEMTTEDPNIVDAAAGHGIELPYSCKAGVCATCRTRLLEGEVRMDTNYALEDWEVERGFVLACQSRPLTPVVLLDYDDI